MSENLHLYARTQINTEANDSLGKIAKRIKPGSHVLDVGCATGSLGCYLKDFGCVVDGIEYNPESAALARPFYREIWLGDIERDPLEKFLAKNKYQYIVLADVLEHLRDPGKLLRVLSQSLQPDGQFLISIPNISHMGVILELLSGDFRYRQEGLLDQTHLRFFTKESFTRLLTENQLIAHVIDYTILDIRHTEFKEYTTQATQIGIAEILRKNPDNIVYQFIFTATPNKLSTHLEENNTARTPPVGPRLFSTLYFSAFNEEFNEGNSQSLPVPLGSKRHRIAFSYPQGKAKVLRFDPSEQKVIILLHSIKLYSSGKLIWSFDKRTKTLLSVPHGGIRLSSDEAETSNQTIRMICESNDPYFHIPAEQEKIQLSDTLEIEISTPLSLPNANKQSEDKIALELYYTLNDIIEEKRLLDSQPKSLEKKLSITSIEPKQVLGSRSWHLSKPIRISANFFRATKSIFTVGIQGKNTRRNLARKIYNSAPIPSKIKLKITPYIKRLIKKQYGQDYTSWIKRYDTLSQKDIKLIRNDMSSWKINPKISIIMPTYNSSEIFLKKSIESVRNQLYQNWELCIADDASTVTHVKQLLKHYSDLDKRIKITFRESNGHISEASNSALELATGDYVALLDHDDELSKHALYWAAAEINKHLDAALIYSDEDKIDASGRRSSPYFKPDWNPDLLLCQNYISHLGIYKKSILDEIGAFRVGFEGSQDWDLVLRFTRNLAPERIHHIPAVLYHWRMAPGSTACAVDAKPYVLNAARKALIDHCGNDAQPVTFEEACQGVFHLPHFKPQNDPLVSIIIPTRNGYDDLKICIESLRKTTYSNYEVLIIDNQSDEHQTLDYLHQLSQCQKYRILSYPYAFDYAAMHNWAVPQAKGEFICLLNNDTEIVTPDWLTEMTGQAQRIGVGAVGAKLLYPDDTLQHGGVITGIGGIEGHAHKYHSSQDPGYCGRAALAQNFSAVTGACLLVKKQYWLERGGMASELPVAFNDVDFCLRLSEMGLRNVWLPQAVLYHHESRSRGSDIAPEKLKRFALEHAYMQWRWGNRINNDPAYNPNLTLQHANFALAWPPRTSKPWQPNENLVPIPYGLPNVPTQWIEVTQNRSIEGNFLIPRGLNEASLLGLTLLIRTNNGRSDGALSLELSDDQGHNIQANRSLAGAHDNMPLSLYFEDMILRLTDVKQLNFHITLTDNSKPAFLLAYPLDARWGHHIVGYEEFALRIDLILAND